MKRRTLFLAASLLVLGVSLAGVAHAQAWPAKPLRMVVPFGAGSPPDVLGRLFSRTLNEALGQQVVVENRVGAGGTIGSEAVAKSAPDGYTLMLGSSSTLAIAPSLYPALAYRPERDFAPVMLAASAPFFVIVHPSLGVSSLREFIELARAKPGQYTYGSTGNGTPLHIAGEMFKSTTGVSLTHVPYKDMGPVNNDFLAGRVQVMFQQLPAMLQHIRSGNLRALAVASSKRDPQVPEVPTSAEAGLAGYEVSSWFGVVAPRGVPAEIIQRLNAELQKSLAQPEVRATLGRLGFEPVGGSAEQFGSYIQSELKRWSDAVKASGAKLD